MVQSCLFLSPTHLTLRLSVSQPFHVLPGPPGLATFCSLPEALLPPGEFPTVLYISA